MTAATWILIYKKPQDAAAAGEALKFFAWAFAKGDKMAEELDYVADAGQGRAATSRRPGPAEIKDASGKPLFALSH